MKALKDYIGRRRAMTKTDSLGGEPIGLSQRLVGELAPVRVLDEMSELIL